jgi:hypothetical protein
VAAAAPLHFHESAFVADKDGKPAGWTTWSARAETAPHTFVDRGWLAISGKNNIAEHGGLRATMASVIFITQ